MSYFLQLIPLHYQDIGDRTEAERIGRSADAEISRLQQQVDDLTREYPAMHNALHEANQTIEKLRGEGGAA